jgi:hypothetical protein
MPEQDASNRAPGDGTAIDPRYNPAFQRGFTGEVVSGLRAPSALRRTPEVDPVPNRGTVAQPVQDRLIEPPPASRFAPQLASGSAEDAAPAPSFDAAVTPASTPTLSELARNPFIVALTLLAVVLIGGGAVWAAVGFSTIARNGGTRNEVEFWAAQTMSFGVPLAIIVGLAVVAVVLAQFARAWKR